MLINANIWELYWILSSQMTKTFRDNWDKILCSKQAATLFSRCSNEVKNVLVPLVRPCMHHNYGGISESHTCKDCVSSIILDAEHCCNLSAGVALIVWFTTNGMCVKNNTIIYVPRATNSKRDCEHDLYCCLLPRCEALRACRSGFPIATALYNLPWRASVSSHDSSGSIQHSYIGGCIKKKYARVSRKMQKL